MPETSKVRDVFRRIGFDFYGFTLLCDALKYKRSLETLGYHCVLMPETILRQKFTVYYLGAHIDKPSRQERGCYGSNR